MKRFNISGRRVGLATLALLAAAGIGWLLLYRLATLVGGLSANEAAAATSPVGWHGIYHSPLYLPLKLVRSVVFYLAPNHGQLLTRLPNAFFGGLAVAAFGWLIWLWHGTRTALLATALFATGAWTLHVSRLASFDVLYFWAVPTLLLVQVLFHRYGHHLTIWYGALAVWGLMLYVPGLVWLVLIQLFNQRKLLLKAWSRVINWPRRLLSLAVILVWLPLLVLDLTRPGQLVQWAGLPASWPTLHHLAKQFGGVFVHLFVRGPQYPELWLARAPILDVFSLICCGLGIYFYATHLKAARSLNLALLAVAGVILVGLGGPVGLSLLVPMLYVASAAGIAYLLHAWLKVFPLNPLARGLGIGAVSLAVGLSCAYGLRAYFVAWPHYPTTKETFVYYRP